MSVGQSHSLVVTAAPWTEQAACRGAPVDLWFTTGRGRPMTREAVAVCESCPVQSECLVDALDVEAHLPRSKWHGIRGGLTVRQRIRLASTT